MIKVHTNPPQIPDLLDKVKIHFLTDDENNNCSHKICIFYHKAITLN